MRSAQSARNPPLVIISIIAVEFTFRGHVTAAPLHVWAFLMSAVTIARAILCHFLDPRIPTASQRTLHRYERYLFTSAVVNAIIIGSSYWLVAANGDLNIKLVMTLLSCFYGIGTLVNAASHFPSFVVVSTINLGQGVLFWMGVGHNDPPQFAIAISFLAILLLLIAFGRENARQFSESIRIRTENVDLLKQLEIEKKIVERALAEARLASESKSRFLAAASHDLRQPLHALTMFLGTLTFHVFTDDAKRLLGRVKETAAVLEEQFNSLLDLSKFDAGAVKPEPTDFHLDQLIEKLHLEFQHEVELKGLSMTSELQKGVCHSDVLLVERVIRNLVSNAVKYTPSGSIVIAMRDKGDVLQVDVIDTGPGIPGDQQVRIFEEYVQLGNPGRQRKHGVGLGLAITKRIDALLGLGLSLDSTVGVGSTFSFKVPRSISAESVKRVERPHTDITTFKTSSNIWILDDDPTVVEGIASQLSAWGAHIESFTNPDALLHRLRNGTTLPHWILTDDMLGAALSGLETAQLLSREFGFGRVCIITGNTEPERLARLRSSGFPLAIKPVRPESLMEIIKA